MLLWSDLKKINTSKLTSLSWVYLIVTPTASVIILKLKHVINYYVTIMPLSFVGNDINYNAHVYERAMYEINYAVQSINLPFSWIAVYFASLFVVISHVISILSMPLIIKENNSYSDYVSKQCGIANIITYINDLVRIPLWKNICCKYIKFIQLNWQNENAIINEIAKLISNEAKTKMGIDIKEPNINREEMQFKLNKINIKSDYSDVFWATYITSDSLNPRIRGIASLFYFMGNLLHAWVLMQATISVIKAI